MKCPFDGAEMEAIEVGQGYVTWRCPNLETQIYEDTKNAPMPDDDVTNED